MYYVTINFEGIHMGFQDDGHDTFEEAVAAAAQLQEWLAAQGANPLMYCVEVVS